MPKLLLLNLWFRKWHFFASEMRCLSAFCTETAFPWFPQIFDDSLPECLLVFAQVVVGIKKLVFLEFLWSTEVCQVAWWIAVCFFPPNIRWHASQIRWHVFRKTWSFFEQWIRRERTNVGVQYRRINIEGLLCYCRTRRGVWRLNMGVNRSLTLSVVTNWGVGIL